MKRRLGVYGRSVDPSKLGLVEDLFDLLIENSFELWISSSFADYIEDYTNRRWETKRYQDLNKIPKPGIEMLITIGGDGTILDTLTSIKDSGIPILGFNTGRLGFLANNSYEELQLIAGLIGQKKYTLDKRALIQLQSPSNLFKECNYALNEFTLHKKDTSSMISIKVSLDDLYIAKYWANGLIVSTPTGSTAYSLSCGGPIVVPQSQNLIITPICPHNLNLRPIIVPDNVTLSLEVEGREKSFMASLDSRSVTVTAEDTIRLRKAKFDLNLVQFEHQNFFTTIRNKLLWGKDNRNY